MRCDLAGYQFAVNRAMKYGDSVTWERHSTYKGFEILRAYHKENGRPCALYSFVAENGVRYVSENLDGIKKEVTMYKEVWSQ